ncbi:MAG: class I SAM-dependent methyltransferase [Acidobacteriota bacterium]
MNKLPNERAETSSAELDASERQWWQTFAELEYRFAWAQPPAMQRILRGRYMREIVRLAGKGGHILELGCGTGWLCLALARSGASNVCGLDFSPAQIAIAKMQAENAGLADRVHFMCADATSDCKPGENFDCVVIHGFLHHLDKTEIARTLTSVRRWLKPSGVLVVFEPIHHKDQPGKPCSRWERWQWILARWSSRGRRWGLRRESSEEARWRALFARRTVGVAPYGPSPKEIGFIPGELESYLCRHFIVERKQPCMVMSHLVVQEWLLRELSHPRLSRLLLPCVARAAAWMDRRLLHQAELPANLWVMTLFVCHLKVFNA